MDCQEAGGPFGEHQSSPAEHSGGRAGQRLLTHVPAVHTHSPLPSLEGADRVPAAIASVPRGARGLASHAVLWLPG